MKENDIIRTVTIRHKSEGADQAKADLKGIAAAQDQLAKSSENLATASESSARRQTSAARALEQYERRVSPAARAAYELEKVQSSLNRALDQNPAALDRAVRILDTYIDRLNKARTAEQQMNRGSLTTGTLQGNLDRAFNVGASSAGSAAASAEVFVSQFGGIEGIAASRAKEIGEAFGLALNESLIAGTAKSARDSAAVFASEFDQLDEIAAQKAQQIGSVFAADLNAALIAGPAKSARDSASVFQQQFDRLDEMAQQKAEQIGRNFQEQLNQSFGIGGGGARAAGATFSALEAELDRLDKIATAKAQHIADVTQRGISESFGIGSTAKSARESAMAFEEAALAEEKMATSAARLRAAINPLEAEMTRIGKEMVEYRKLVSAGAVTQQEFAAFQQVGARRLQDFEKSLKNAGTAGRLMSGEMANLGFQLNDVITGIALGQSPFMILAQQGGQVYQILSNSRGGVSGALQEIGQRFMGLLTPARALFGGLAAGAAAALLALNQYLEAQQKVQMALTGAGRASGATVGGINSIAQQGSSPTGLSISEARELASAIAATGKVANDNILPIVQMGKDIAHAFGVDAADAQKMLAEAFSDPARGAESLNQRLGFLDATTKTQINNLVAQNKIYEAQKVLLAGVQSGLAGVNDAVASSTKFWTSLGNSISNAWDKLGEWLSRATGVGSKLDLEGQIKIVSAEIERLQTKIDNRSATGTGGFGKFAKADADALAKAKGDLERYTKALEDNARASEMARERQRTFLQESTMRSVLPDVSQFETLKNQQVVLTEAIAETKKAMTAAFADPNNFGSANDLTTKLDQLARALGVVTANINNFKTAFQSAGASLDIAKDAITAYSPGAKGEIARRQSLLSNSSSVTDDVERNILANKAQQNAVLQVTAAIKEQQRERVLGARQSADAQNLEISLVGKSISQQFELRANLQSYQQIYQEAARNRTLVNGKLNEQDQKHLDTLKQINAETARSIQLRAEEDLRKDIGFERSQIGLTSSDQQINSRLRTIYGDNITGEQAQFYRKQLQINEALRQADDIGRDVFMTFFQGMRQGKSAIEALDAALSRLADRLLDLALNSAWSGLSRGLLGGLGSALGGGGPGYVNTDLGNGFGGAGVMTFASGGAVRGPGTSTSDSILARISNGEFVVNARSAQAYMPLLHEINRAPGFASGGMVGGGSGMSRLMPNITVKIENHGNDNVDVGQAQSDGNGGFELPVIIGGAAAQEMMRPGSALRKATDNRNRVASR